MKLLLFVLGFALANAATTITRNNDLERSITIHRNTPEKYPTEFELGKTHRFNYTGDVRTSFPQTSNETIGERIQCIVEIVPLTTNIWNMRLVEPTMYEINGTHDKPQRIINSTKITEQLRDFLQWNVTFLITQGKIEIVFANKTEPEWVTNIKKGILNMVTLQLKKDNFYEIDEEGVSGTCKTLYTIKEWTNEDLVTIMNVTKVRDLTNCSVTALNKLSTFKFHQCEECTKVEKSMEATATLKYNITGTKQRFIINGVQSDARYVFFPLGPKGGSVFVHVNQTMHLINVTEDPLFTKPPEQEPRGTLMYRFPKLVKVQEEMLTTVNKVNYFLMKLEEQSIKPFTIDAPSHFILLVRSLSEADYITLENIWTLVSPKPVQRKWLIEALPYVNQEEVTRLVKDLIIAEETLLTTDEKITILSKLGTIRQPTEKAVEHLKDACESEFLQWPHNKKVNTTYIYNIVRVRDTCWRSLGIQINMLKTQFKYVSPTLVQSLTNCETIFDKTTKLTEWDTTVYKTTTVENKSDKEMEEYLTLEEAKALLNKTKVTKVREMCLIAIGEAGLLDHITYIQPILEQTWSNQTLDVRIAATIALRKMTVPNKVLSLLLPVLRNPYEDSELRATAYLVIVKTNKRPSVFSLIGQELNMEKSKQVRSFIYSHLKMLAEDVEPCNRDLAVAARYGLIYTKPFELGPTFSKARSFRAMDQETKLGTKVTMNTIFSEGELTPSKTDLRVNVDMFGRRTTLLNVDLRTSGMTNLVEKMFGHDGHYYKRKNVFDLLKESKRKRRSVSSNEEELTKINKKVSPYEVTPEDPRVRLYISMFGNRITDIDINKDYLTTLIKEGKIMTDYTNLDEELAKLQTFNFTKGMMLMDYKQEHPTIMGLPLSFNTTVGSILRVKVNTTFKGTPTLLTQEKLVASVNVTPEVIVNAIFKYGIHTPLSKYGSAINTTFNVTLPVNTNITVDLTKKKYEVLFPQMGRDVMFVNFTHELYTFWQRNNKAENQTVVNTTLTNRKPIMKVLCMEPINDLPVCMNVSWVPRLGQPESAFQPLTGPSHLCIYNRENPYTPKYIKYEYHVKSTDDTWETDKNVDLTITSVGIKRDDTPYENVTTIKFRLSHPNKRIMITTTDSTRPEWESLITLINKNEGEVDMQAEWGVPKVYTMKVNNTDKTLRREFFYQINSPNWTWNDTRNVTFFWAELPEWLRNVTYLVKTYVFPTVLETVKRTTGVEYMYEPLLNPIVNSTTVSLKIKTNFTMDVMIHLPLEKITVVNVTVPVNTSVLNKNVPVAVETIQRRFTEKYLSGNCTYNRTGKFLTYDKLRFNYNLTGSCPHVLTKDCSPDKRFTVLVQNTLQSNTLIRTTPIVTVFVDNHKLEMVTRTNDEVYVKYNGMEHMTQEDAVPIETEIGWIERNTTHITMKGKIGLTVVYSKDNVTTYLSPWYVNKTCGLCGDFNGETFLDMKNTRGEEVKNSTKFGASWLVQGDDCKDLTCKLAKEELYPLPETVYLANKPAACFSKEPVKVCPLGCNNESPENIFTSEFIPKKQHVKVPFFCMASENVEETKNLMKTRSELIKSQPIDLYRDIEVPHSCNCVDTCNEKM